MKRTEARAKFRHGIFQNAYRGGMIQKTTRCNNKTISTRHHEKCVELTNAAMTIVKGKTGLWIAGCDLIYRTITYRISPRVNGQQYNRSIGHWGPKTQIFLFFISQHVTTHHTNHFTGIRLTLEKMFMITRTKFHIKMKTPDLKRAMEELCEER